MSYLYQSNNDAQAGFSQLEIQLDSGDSALLTMGHYYDLSAAELARARRYIVLVSGTVTAEDPIGISRLPVKGNPTNDQIPQWSLSEAAFVPATVSGVSGGPYASIASVDALDSRVNAQRLFISIEDDPYKAEIDGATNTSTAVQAATDDVSANGGGTVWVGGHAAWTADTMFTLRSNVTYASTKGIGKLDFSGRLTFANDGDGTGNEAFMLGQGALSGSALPLLKDAKKPTFLPIVIATSGQVRSGTTITVTTVNPHGLSVGDYVFLRGGGSASWPRSGQDIFYSETTAGVAADPVRVDTVADTTHFTYAIGAPQAKSMTGLASTDVLTASGGHDWRDGVQARFTGLTGGAGLSNGVSYYAINCDRVAGTMKLALTSGGAAIDFTTDITAGTLTVFQDTTFTGAGHVSPFGKIVRCDTRTLNADDMVVLGSAAIRQDSIHETIGLGETNIVERVVVNDADGCVLLKKPVQDNLLVADSATLTLVDPIENVNFNGLTIIGHGYNPSDVDAGDKAIRLDYARNCNFKDLIFYHVDLVNLELRTSFNCRFEDNEIVMDDRNISGRITHFHYVQYGLSYANGTEDLFVSGNTFHNCRHGIVQTSTSAIPGIARGVTITGNYFMGCWLGAISTHQGFDSGVIVGNHIVGAVVGINIRYGLYTLIEANKLYGCEVGVQLSIVALSVQVKNNVIDGCWSGITYAGPFLTTDAAGELEITGNQIFNSEQAIEMNITLSGVLMKGIRIDGNRIKNVSFVAISVIGGDSTLSADGFYGSISHNIIDDVGQVTAGNTIRATNAKRVSFIGNIILSATGMTRGLFIDGSGSLGCLERANTIVGATVASVSFTTGTGHKTESGGKQVLTLTNGSLTPLYANAINYLQTDTETGKAATGVAATDIITIVAHGWTSAMPVLITALAGGAGLTTNTIYFVTAVTTDTFKLAATSGGAAIDFTTDITSATIARCGVDTIDGSALDPGSIVFLRTGTSSRKMLVRDAGVSLGNIQTAGGTAVTLDSTRDKWMGFWDGTEWDGFPVADV